MSWMDKLPWRRHPSTADELTARIEQAEREREEVARMRARTDRLDARLAADTFGAAMETAFRARRERPT